ncbi:SGNH hydrolase-type esterase domain-containing protein [Kockovaella imperatae]|uniref:SGNH hydrolase-type esterase domain-containing protein n=1 Tax=Kockovaella imperatae TaxID=4999 RepID=A0A1Y1UPQ5_9TREE|nr:SGNH hydrolase-type esterase domain-containing protein [Kockovaella imperatae]ORX39557.1 SGNH hydrolase-type esterase domain-containing protein [Kockovaella imperatae]
MNPLALIQNVLVWILGLHVLSTPVMYSTNPVSKRWVDIWETAYWGHTPHLNFPEHKAFPRNPTPRLFVNTTIRQTFRTSFASELIRVRISNEWSSEELSVSGASVALPAKYHDHFPGSPAINPNSSVRLTFAGSESVDIPKGASILSDPVNLDLEELGDISVSLYFAEGAAGDWAPGHEGAKSMSWMDFGNLLDVPSFDVSSATEFRRWYYVSSIEAYLPNEHRAVVCFGDSITDQGQGELPINEYHGWTDRLAQRLLSSSTESLRTIGMINAGISGDTVYGGGILRFDRDVISRPGVEYVVLLMGINDIQYHANTTEAQDQAYTRIRLAHSQLIDRAHEAGIPIFGATITPFLTPPNYTLPPPLHGARPSDDPVREATRQKINHWIRTEADYDFVFDFDAATRDPQHPQRLQTAFGGLDYLHPSAAGLLAMGNAVDLDAFEKFRRIR